MPWQKHHGTGDARPWARDVDLALGRTYGEPEKVKITKKWVSEMKARRAKRGKNRKQGRKRGRD